jgi:SPP1 gp7 family putative phage head morphogenesis protein
MQKIELKPIKESTEDFEAVEKQLKAIFRQEIYLPLIRELGEPSGALQNSKYNLLEAIRSGRITYCLKSFFGKFSAAISKELKQLGATWDRVQGAWKIPLSSLPMEVRAAISSGEVRVKEKLAAIDKRLAQIMPEKIADRVSIEKIFDRLLQKTDRQFHSSVKGLIVPPQLTPERRARIASEWQNNMKLWVKDFAESEITKLRKDIQKNAFAGKRYDTVIKTIQDSYEVSSNKAKFLARQETSLLLTKFKETRYTDSGINEYRWVNVSGSPRHPVRPRHKALGDASKKGKIFRWDDPPITSEPHEPERRNNPGQDFNCRCFAVPVVQFKK